MSDVVIRDAEFSDREAITDLTLSAYSEYGEIMSAENWQAYRANIIAALDGVSDAGQLVAVAGGKIVGTVLLYLKGAAFVGVESDVDWPEVRLLAVAPEARSKGVGKALMAECVQRVRKYGGTIVALHTMESMQAARRLYGRMGFVRTAELDFVPRKDIHAEGYCLLIGDQS